ncbi:MAG: cache domain-containing protein [Thermodesulfobacteriota bacterium]
MFKGKKISTIIWINFMILISILVGALGCFWIHQERERFRTESARMEEQYLAGQRQFLQAQVNEVIDFIDYTRSQQEDRVHQALRSRVYEARDLAWNLHRKFKDKKTDAEIKAIVREALRAIWFHDGRGYYFATALDGTSELFADKPELEGTNLLSMEDTDGKPVIKDLIALVRESHEGFYRYTWTKPDSQGKGFPKLAFVVRFEPFDWFIGTGEYLDDMERELQRECLNRIGRIRFGEDGYIFVFRFDGIYVSHFHRKFVGQNMLWVTDPNGLKINEELLRASQQPGGGFITYVWNKPSLGRDARKLSYAKAVKEWQWVIGTGAYIDDIERTIAETQGEANERIKKQVGFIVFLTLTALGIAVVSSLHFSRTVRRQMDIFTNFFEKAADTHEKIDKEKVGIDEFRRLTDHANRMIGDLRRWEEALAHEKRRFQALVEHAPFGIITLGQDGKVNYLNPTFERMFGYGSQDLPDDETWFRLAYPDPEAQRKALSAWKDDEERLKAEEESSGTYTVRCKDQSEKTVHFRHVKLLGDEHLVTAEDITERRRLEAQLRQAAKMEAIGQLAGGVAHDFNNLLTAIIGYSDVLLARTQDDKAVHDKLAQIRRAADRAAGLTRQLLAFGRKQVLDVKVLDLNAAIENIEKILVRLIGEHIRLVSHLDPGLGSVKADPGQLEQVIINLAVNARDAMPNGGTLTIETANVVLDRDYCRSRPEVNPGRYAMAALSDTGVGMSQEILQRIFDPFFTTKEKGSGTGLGLATVYGIVKQHGGHVAAYSEPGRGTTFKVYLPRVDQPAESRQEQPGEAQGPRGTETVLLVEDEDMVRQLAREMLESHGYTVLEASTPGKAVQICQDHDRTIDLLLTDVVLPEIDGRTLFDRLSRQRPEMKVLYISGYTENFIVHRGVLDPGVSFLPKPFTIERLVLRVRQVLDRS